METDKIYINPGNVVMVRHDIDNKPKMMVVDKVTRTYATKEGDKKSTFEGIKCRWYDKNQSLQEAIFSTKDLILL